MKNNRSKQRRGFTLVELLIVIVVIGVLSAMMMLSSTEAVTSARASNIVSNLRNLKTAALSWYADHLDVAEASDFSFSSTATTTNGNTVCFSDVTKYMNNESSSSFTDYAIVGEDDKNWYVVYKGALDTRVSQKLAGRASSVGLLKGTDTTANSGTYEAQTSGTKFEVKMLVLEHNGISSGNNNNNNNNN